MTDQNSKEDPKDNSGILRNIPPHFANHLSRSVEAQTDTSQMSGPLEAVRKLAPPAVAQKAPAQKIPTIFIGGNEIHADAQTFLMYLVATEFSKNKSIAKILKEIKFVFKDVNGLQIYPKVKKSK